MSKPIVLLLGALILGACSFFGPGLTATEAVLEEKVDEGINSAIKRMCKGPVDIAVRTFKNHPTIHITAIAECPDTFGWLAAQVLAQDARHRAIADVVRDTMLEMQGR